MITDTLLQFFDANEYLVKHREWIPTDNELCTLRQTLAPKCESKSDLFRLLDLTSSVESTHKEDENEIPMEPILSKITELGKVSGKKGLDLLQFALSLVETSIITSPSSSLDVVTDDSSPLPPIAASFLADQMEE